MKQLTLITAALVAGLLGGMTSPLILRLSERNPQQVIRARSFELVNATGQMISYWGIDDGGNIVLAFGSRGLQKGSDVMGRGPEDVKSPRNQLEAIGLQGNDMPVLQMNGADRKVRVSLLLTPDSKPALSLEDATGPRVHLGIEGSDTGAADDNDWALAFYPERARIGMYAEKIGGLTYVRGSFAVHEDRVQYPYRQTK